MIRLPSHGWIRKPQLPWECHHHVLPNTDMQFIHGDCNHLTMEINYQTSHTNPNSKSSSTTPLRKQKQKYICHKMSSDYHPVTVSEILPITPKLICENQNMPRHVNYYLVKKLPKNSKTFNQSITQDPNRKVKPSIRVIHHYSPYPGHPFNLWSSLFTPWHNHILHK